MCEPVRLCSCDTEMATLVPLVQARNETRPELRTVFANKCIRTKLRVYCFMGPEASIVVVCTAGHRPTARNRAIGFDM